MTETKPLVLDVDGTFLKTDMLFETFWAGLGTDPLATLRTTLANFRDPARLKADLARIAPLRVDLLPVNPEVADLALRSRMAGREVVLASASDRSLVEPAHRRRRCAAAGGKSWPSCGFQQAICWTAIYPALLRFVRWRE